MASRLSQEEENYVRMCLLTGISTRAARIVFDQEFPPSLLDSTLKRETHKLRKLRNEGKINQLQWNLLFRNKPDVPDSKTFEVTLMITLVRHLTDPKYLTPPPGGYDRLPLENEKTPTSDLARIKFYRNILAHLVDEKIDNTEFTKGWDIVTDAISRLGGLTMKQECDNLKVKTLDQSSWEIILEIKRSNDEIKELKKSIESLKRANEDMAVDVKKMEMSHKDTVPWNVRAEIKEILDEWKDNDKMFITTRAAKHVLKCIKENSCVTITASSGVGKTATLRNVALQMEQEGYDVLLVTNPDEIIKYYNPTQKTVFVIDDLCGNYSLNQNDIKFWEPAMQRIKKIFSNKLSKMIVACRLQVYQDEKFECLPIFKSCVCYLLSKKLCWTEAEKKTIAELYLQTKAHEIADYYDLYDCFPLLCKLYHENPSPNITHFFKYPFQVYEAEIDMLQKNEFNSKYCALALIVVFNNNLHEEILTEDINEETRAIIENTCEACRLERGTSRLTLQDDLNSFIHTFLKKEQNMYKTIHDKIFDFLAYYFGQKIVRCLIQNADSGLIIKRFLLERQDNMNQFITIVHPKYHQMYKKRMIEDWSKGEVNGVFCNINMKISQFRTEFFCCLNELDTSFQRQLAHTCDVENKDTALLTFCYDGDIAMIDWCFSHDVDVNQCNDDETTPLYVAASEGWTEIVKMLLDKGADCNKCDDDEISPLHVAAREGWTEIVKMLLDKGADCNKCDDNRRSPLEIVRMLLDKGADYDTYDNDGVSPVMTTCNDGYIEIVRMLLDKGADCNKCKNNGWSLVMKACSIRHTEILRMLIDKGADYNSLDRNGRSPVMIACSNDQQQIVRMLLDKGADYNTCDRNGRSPVMTACSNGHADEVMMLFEKRADYHTCDNYGVSPVMTTCSDGHIEIVRMLLDKGADFNKCDNNLWSPLMFACCVGQTEIVRMLLEKRADYNTLDRNGRSPVMIACSNGHAKVVKMLLEKGADYDTCDNVGVSPVMTACSDGHIEIVRTLLDNGADYNECDNEDSSLIMMACISGHTEIVKLLIDKGADYNKCNDDDWSPVKMACISGHKEIVRVLLDKGAYLEKCDNDDWSPLKMACIYRHKEIVRMLLDIGADYNACDSDGSSPLMRARREGNTEIVNILLDKGVDCKTCNHDGETAVMIASKSGHSEIVNVINEHSRNENGP